MMNNFFLHSVETGDTFNLRKGERSYLKDDRLASLNSRRFFKSFCIYLEEKDQIVYASARPIDYLLLETVPDLPVKVVKSNFVDPGFWFYQFDMGPAVEGLGIMKDYPFILEEYLIHIYVRNIMTYNVTANPGNLPPTVLETISKIAKLTEGFSYDISKNGVLVKTKHLDKLKMLVKNLRAEFFAAQRDHNSDSYTLLNIRNGMLGVEASKTEGEFVSVKKFPEEEGSINIKNISWAMRAIRIDPREELDNAWLKAWKFYVGNELMTLRFDPVFLQQRIACAPRCTKNSGTKDWYESHNKKGLKCWVCPFQPKNVQAIKLAPMHNAVSFFIRQKYPDTMLFWPIGVELIFNERDGTFVQLFEDNSPFSIARTNTGFLQFMCNDKVVTNFDSTAIIVRHKPNRRHTKEDIKTTVTDTNFSKGSRVFSIEDADHFQRETSFFVWEENDRTKESKYASFKDDFVAQCQVEVKETVVLTLPDKTTVELKMNENVFNKVYIPRSFFPFGR